MRNLDKKMNKNICKTCHKNYFFELQNPRICYPCQTKLTIYGKVPRTPDEIDFMKKEPEPVQKKEPVQKLEKMCIHCKKMKTDVFEQRCSPCFYKIKELNPQISFREPENL